MRLIEGVIEAFSFKDIPEDKFGNVYRTSVKVGDEWIGFGSTKEKVLKWRKEAKVWEEVSKGDTITVLVTENGSFLNAKQSDIKGCKKGSGTPSSASGSRGSQTSSAKASPSNSGGTDWARKDAGAAASASIDKALRYISLRGGEVKSDYASVLSIARDFQDMVRTLADEILAGDKPAAPSGDSDGGKPEGKPVTPSSRKKPATPPPMEDDFNDDDIPFN